MFRFENQRVLVFFSRLLLNTKMLSNICLFFVCIFSSVNSINFLGGFLTYQNTQETRTNSTFLRIQIRFQIENKHFHCTNNRIRLLDEPNYIQCFSNQSNKACRDFHQELSGHCQIENELNQYLIIERQFLLDVEYSKSISLFYVRKIDLKTLSKTKLFVFRRNVV